MLDVSTLNEVENTQCRLEREGGLDLVFRGWEIGEGSNGSGGGSGCYRDWTRGVDVTIYATVGGQLVTYRRHWSRWQGESETHKAAVHQTAESALAWLSPEGVFFPAEQDAWEEACGTLPALKGLDVEEIA